MDALLGLRLLIERRQRADRRRAHRHRMRVLGQPLEEAAEVLVQHRVMRDVAENSSSSARVGSSPLMSSHATSRNVLRSASSSIG